MSALETTSASKPEAVMIGGERAVVWCGPDGQLRAARDLCPHRRAPLSAGTVVDGLLHCPYHGWAFDGAGRCTVLPAAGAEARIPVRAQLDLLPVPDRLAPAPDVADLEPPAAGACSYGSAEAVDWIDGDTVGLARFWHAVARLGEVADPETEAIKVELLGQQWRIQREGEYWSARSITGQIAWGVREHLDHLWLAPEEPLAPLPPVPEWGEPGWHYRRLSRTEGRLGVGLLLDNQLDAGHFPFVHITTFGTPAAAAVPPAEITRNGTTVSSIMRIPIAATNDPQALAGARPLQQHRTMRYEYHAPLWLRLQLDYEAMGGSTLILFAFVPLGAGRARMDIDILFKHPDGFTEEQLDVRVGFEERVIAEDLRLQRLFEDLRLPLEPTVELHTKADRLSLQCRQLLRDLLSA
ncbi:MAG: Rieske (2Fe-2S) iron-sulfur domain protein [Acidimicrobiia bacterium]|nr:Rieske (2Fe-2S) iron-sulfur domain protein [Acidimicrobiia bacterium]